MSITCLASGPTPLDEQGWEAFYREQFRLVYHYVSRRVGNRQEAEDLTSSIFLKAVRGLRQERGEQSMRSWLLRVAHTTVIDYWRARARATSISLEALQENGWVGPAQDDLFEGLDRPEERVQRVLQALLQRERAILTYRFLHGLSSREKAGRMGLAEEGNVKTSQHRALKRAAALVYAANGEID